MSAFVLTNWFFCVVTSVLLLMLIWRRRFLLVKPSMIVIIFFHLCIQWAATIESPFIEGYLPDPWVFALLAQGFPVIGLLISAWTGRRSARIIWQRVLHPETVSSKVRHRVILFLAGLIAFFVVFYLQVVHFSSTGLYAIFVDPSGSAMAREESLKLVEGGLIRYGYSFMAYGFAPLLSVLLLWQVNTGFKRRRWIAALANLAAIGGVLFVVSLTGARSFAALIILVMAFAWFLKRGFPLNPIYITLVALLILAFPVLLTILREGKIPDMVLFWDYLSGGIFERVFYSPMETGLYYTHFAQTVGFMGMAGVPKLATLFGISPINAANYLGLLYTDTYIESVNMNTSYVFAYYCYFGIGSFIFSLLGLWLLDAVLLIYRKISGLMLTACMASLLIPGISLISGEYTVVLLTHGFIVILLTSVFVDRFYRSRVNPPRRIKRIQPRIESEPTPQIQTGA